MSATILENELAEALEALLQRYIALTELMTTNNKTGTMWDPYSDLEVQEAQKVLSYFDSKVKM